VHATLSAYTAGRCRCTLCRRAFADYRAARRADGKDEPREPRQQQTDGHLPRDWFNRKVWQPAVRAAGLELPVRMHDLRHAHASWLLAGGADLQVVKERLGHASIATTERYLHTLPDADDTALDALTAYGPAPDVLPRPEHAGLSFTVPTLTASCCERALSLRSSPTDHVVPLLGTSTLRPLHSARRQWWPYGWPAHRNAVDVVCRATPPPNGASWLT
jgi:hypothetical protein